MIFPYQVEVCLVEGRGFGKICVYIEQEKGYMQWDVPFTRLSTDYTIGDLSM
jgi:hypothetical protein